MIGECGDWLKLYRKTLTNPVVMKDADHLAIWIYILLNATWCPKDVMFGGKRITLNPGQFTTGRKQIAMDLHVSESKVQRVLKCYESEQMIEQVTDFRCRLITVVSWDDYQASEQVNEQVVNSFRTGSEQVLNTNKEYKNIRSNNTIKDSIRTPDGIPTAFKTIVEAWNELPLRDIKRISEGSKRYTLLKARIKEAGTDEVVKAIDSIKNSSFLLGQNKTGWTITFDWFIKPGNFAKVLEGNYEDKVESAIDESWKEEYLNG